MPNQNNNNKNNGANKTNKQEHYSEEKRRPASSKKVYKFSEDRERRDSIKFDISPSKNDELFKKK